MTRPDRIVALDAVRGMAVMGILLLNIVDFGLPRCAYTDPTCYRPDDAGWWTWAVTFMLADGKMRGLFTMLFGASALLVAERAARDGRSPLRTHYARMAVLLAIGLVHAWLIWSGDILVLYAVAGMLLYPALRLPSRSLVAVAAILLAAQFLTGALAWHAARQFETAAEAPGAPPALRAEWQRFAAATRPSPQEIAAEIEVQRGGWAEVLSYRFRRTHEALRYGIPAILGETIALMLVGIALFRSGFFSGDWPRRRYVWLIALGYGVALPLYVPIVRWLEATRFDPVAMLLTDSIHLVLLRPWVALAHAAVVILLVRRGRADCAMTRLAAVGRMALSNYLATSLVCTLLFCGYGLGWFGRFDRWQLYLLVPPIWLAMIAWSAAWLARFAQGPVERLWRMAGMRLAR